MESLLYHAVSLGDAHQAMSLLGVQSKFSSPSPSSGPTLDLSYAHGPNRTTLLHLCCSKRSARMLHFFLNELSSYPERARLRIINQREDAKIGGYTPLHRACSEGSVDLVRMLLEHGADPDIEDNNSGFTCLHIAIRKGHFEVAKELIQRGGADVDARDEFGNNAAYWLRERVQACLSEKDEQLEQMLGEAKCASIEERFFKAVKDRVDRGLPLKELPEAKTSDLATYGDKVKSKGKGKTAGKKKGKGKKKK